MTEVFRRKHPCDNCPFRSRPPKHWTPKRPGDDGLFHGLHPERAEDIADSLHAGQLFYCHKSVDYEEPEDWDDEYGPFEGDTTDGHACPGALATAERDGYLDNFQLVRISMRLGLFNPDDYDFPNAPVYDGIEEWVEAVSDRYFLDGGNRR